MNRLALWVDTQRASAKWLGRGGAIACGVVLLAACGGGPRYPAMDLGPEPQTVDEALRQLASAKHELGIADSAVTIQAGHVTDQPGATRPYNKSDPPAQPTAPTSDMPQVAQASAPRSEALTVRTQSSAGSGDSDGVEESKRAQCMNPCRALASIKRASEALCRMTAEADERCISARKTLVSAAERTASCACQQ